MNTMFLLMAEFNALQIGWIGLPEEITNKVLRNEHVKKRGQS
ncbi:hypothetical protein MMK73_000175 [Providencia rettgeri]